MFKKLKLYLRLRSIRKELDKEIRKVEQDIHRKRQYLSTVKKDNE